MSNVFQFKQFSVDQTSCAMKINTDGVLVGALAEANDPKSILDIGTGTGVIALMLAQRFQSVQIDAVEIDISAAQTAGENFANSPFADRLNIFPTDFQSYFKDHPVKKYNVIISNPPFHLNSLESPEAKRSLAKHTGNGFFEELIERAVKHLSDNGSLWLILPLQAAELVEELAKQVGFHLQKEIAVHSFSHSKPHRLILSFGFDEISTVISKLVIYEAVNRYSKEYTKLLQPYFIAF
jgi:tRNA1Val (adenine37-N6)-methyltransferase